MAYVIAAAFVAGIIVGAFVWIPLTVRKAENDAAARMRIVSRYRDGGGR